MKLAGLAAICAAVLSACAGASSSECTAGDWYGIGRRDGRMGAWPQAELYARRCGQQTQVDHARYGEGWQQGMSERPRPPR